MSNTKKVQIVGGDYDQEIEFVRVEYDDKCQDNSKEETKTLFILLTAGVSGNVYEELMKILKKYDADEEDGAFDRILALLD